MWRGRRRRAWPSAGIGSQLVREIIRRLEVSGCPFIVVWMDVRAGVLPAAEGPVRLGLARWLGIESIATATLCQGALLRAMASGVSADDTLFVELAARSACPLVTFDKAVRAAFPDIARRPRDVVGR